MRKLAVRAVTATLVAGSAAIGFAPIAVAETDVKLTPSVAAWYQPNPTCSQPSGCVTTGSLPALPVAPPVPLPEVPLSPFPAGTLHVGYTGSQEVARTYLAFPYDAVDGDVTSAKIDIPLDVTPENGSAQPETAKVQACLVSGDITAVEGSVNQPPQVSCEQRAKLKYVATPSPHLTGDLAPLLTGLVTTSGIALLPDNEDVTETDAWRVVFSSASRTDSAKTAAPSLTLAVEETETETPEVPVDTPVDTGSGPVTAPIDSGSPPLAPLDPGTVDPGVAPTVPDTGAGQPQVPVTEPRTITVGYQYPAVWLLPLVFLLLVPAIARALTKDLTPIGA